MIDPAAAETAHQVETEHAVTDAELVNDYAACPLRRHTIGAARSKMFEAADEADQRAADHGRWHAHHDAERGPAMVVKLGHEIEVGDWIIDRYSEDGAPVAVAVLEVQHHTDPDSDRWLPGGVGLVVSDNDESAWDIGVRPDEYVDMATPPTPRPEASSAHV